MKDGQLQERNFFYGILGTVYEKETKEFIYYSRNKIVLVEESIEDDKVAIDPEILKELENVLHLRSKFNLQYDKWLI